MTQDFCKCVQSIYDLYLAVPEVLLPYIMLTLKVIELVQCWFVTRIICRLTRIYLRVTSDVDQKCQNLKKKLRTRKANSL